MKRDSRLWMAAAVKPYLVKWWGFAERELWPLICSGGDYKSKLSFVRHLQSVTDRRRSLLLVQVRRNTLPPPAPNRITLHA